MFNFVYFYISTFRSMCAVPTMAVFFSYLTSCFRDMLLRYFLNDFEMVPFAPVVIGIIFVFYIPRALCLYCNIFIFYKT